MTPVAEEEYNGQPYGEVPPEPKGPTISATPYQWVDAAKLPPRKWLYGTHYIRKFVSVTVATGGSGKTGHALAETVAMVTNRPLLGETVHEQCRVWIWNGEDPLEELQRRLQAILLHYDIKREEIEGRLFLDSGRDTPLVLVSSVRDRVITSVDLFNSIIKTIEDNEIDVLIIDPFKMTHQVPENDNGAMDQVVREWARIADRCNVAVDLIHHSRKPSTGQTTLTVDDSRGAGSVINAARNARTINRMTKQEGESAEVDNYRNYVRVENGKANMAPPADEASWRKIISYRLSNGDDVGVVEEWKWPDPLANMTVGKLIDVQKAIDGKGYRLNSQSNNWVGNTIAELLDLDLGNANEKARVKSMIKIRLHSGALKEAITRDEKGKPRPTVEVGAWANM